jgi:heat shock protein HtpX
MNDRELEAVLAHELGHVKHRDILISSIAATIAAAITVMARLAFFFGPRHDDEDSGGGMLGGIAMLFLAPIAAMLIQMAISRTREFSADGAAAKYASGGPDAMIAALRRLEAGSKRIPMDASPATAHMFIVKPFSGSAMMKLFSTHPPTEDRIANLQRSPIA